MNGKVNVRIRTKMFVSVQRSKELIISDQLKAAMRE